MLGEPARVDPATDRITHAFALGGPMSVLRQSGEDLIAVPLSGGVSLLDPETLTVRAATRRPAGKRAGRGVARYGSRLLVTEPADEMSGRHDAKADWLLVVAPQ
ncbi:hypothetical protein [Sorangium sp. So ce1099]|uniref:hypothetical protein n=1 Tax=Sorangium sp. So ce1099 TaxID=3133331 RepID=UPI003F5DAF6C